MARLTDPIAPNGTVTPLTGAAISDDRSAATAVRESLAAKQVCPFCGSQNTVSASSTTNSQGPCPRCTMEDTAATRQATKARIGPWHVLQTRNPAAPGMRYATLLALVNKGQVTARSVVRGPTTHQLWRYAAHVKGLSREFGVCYSCGEALDKTAANCPHCDRAQEPVGNPDALLESREAATASAASSSSMARSIVSDETQAIDPYSIVTRQASAVPVLSHAERLRTGIDPKGADVRRRPDGRVLSAMELAAALQIAPPPQPLQGHPVRTLMITVLIVSILASAIIGFARPDLRNQAVDWTAGKWTTIAQGLANFHLQKPPPTDGITPQPNIDAISSNPTPQTPPAQSPVALPPAEPAALFLSQPTAQVSSDTMGGSASGSIGHDAANPPPTPSILITPAESTPASPAPLPAAPAPVPDQPVSASPNPPPRASILPDRPVLVGAAPSASEVSTLYSRGLAAQGEQDWAEAVRCYEQIELAPKEFWPTDVKVRLANAQRQLGK